MASPLLRRIPWYILSLFALLLIFFIYFIFISYGVLRSDQCTQQLDKLKTSHQDSLMRVLEDYRKQVEKETDLLKKINKMQMDQENLKLQIDSLESRLKESLTKSSQLQEELIHQQQKREIDLSNQQSQQSTQPPVQQQPQQPEPTKAVIVVTEPPKPVEPTTVVVQANPVEDDKAFAVNGVTRESAPLGHAAILLFTFNRARNLDRTLQSLLKYQPPNGNPIFVSQDGEDREVANVLQKYTDQKKLFHLRFHYVRDPQTKDQWAVYYKIASHYKWGLTKIFDELGYERVIIMEDDMEVAPDFFKYFEAMETVLDQDDTLLCASAWNDNGQAQHVQDPNALYRTDCFPGLGWMMRKELWDELRGKWPLGFWDDWLREPTQRKGRSCIYPEINRVYTFGEQGASAGQFFNTYLRTIRLNDKLVDWQDLDLKYLIKSNYDPYFIGLIGNATQISTIEQLDNGNDEQDYVMSYANLEALTQLLNQHGLMTDHKAGVPRSSYMGVTVFRKGHKRIFFAPDTMLSSKKTKPQ